MAKKTIITTQMENLTARELRLTRDIDEANELLTKGWVLMNAGSSHLDSAGYNVKPHFILARIEKEA